MKRYTFIVEYRKGTYISQYKAENLSEALEMWGKDLNFISSEKEKKIINNKIQDEYYYPVEVEGVKNVWCRSFLIINSLLLVNIVETA